MAVDQTVSAITETLLNQFVEYGDPTSGNSMCDVVDFLDTCLTPEERHVAR